MNEWIRKERALEHAEYFRYINPFYRSVLEYRRIHGDITIKQLEAIERNIERERARFNQV